MDLPEVPPDALPATTYVSAVTLAELAQGVHMARDAAVRARRLERLQEVENLYRSPLPFDEAAARSYGLLVGLVVAAGDSGHGFKFAPVLGGLIADVLERKPNPYAARFAWRPRGELVTENARYNEMTADG